MVTIKPKTTVRMKLGAACPSHARTEYPSVTSR